METKIICGFSGCGKTTLSNKISKYKILDLDSSNYSKDKEVFPYNYVDEIEEKYDSGEYDYILVSCHDVVRDELRERGLSYIIVTPKVESRNTYVKRWLARGNDLSFIDKMYRNWNSLIESCMTDPSTKILLEDEEYISNIF